MTNEELLKNAEDAMRFLRTCGADRGPRQSDAIAVLCKRIKIYEAKLVQFNMSTSEMLEDAGISK